MTGNQAEWLRTHRTYEAIGRGRKYTTRGILNAEGKFEAFGPGKRPAITPGCIEVGILAEPDPNLERR